MQKNMSLVDLRPIFYTLPPKPYPYILINANNPSVGLSCIRKYRKNIKSVIIDCGIEIFRDIKVKDYPKNWVNRLIRLYYYVKSTLPENVEVFVTCPDYCDDYYPKSLWINDEITNIERTVQNVINYTGKYNVNWLISIQGWYKKPNSVLRCIKLYREYGIIKEFNFFAVGNLCVESNKKIIYQTISLVRKELRNKRLHIFGLKLNVFPLVKHLIDSFDSMAWTRPVSRKLCANWSCKNKEERIRFFETWLNRLNQLKSQTSLKLKTEGDVK